MERWGEGGINCGAVTSFGIDKRHVFASDKTITSIVAFALFIRHVASFTSFVSIFYRVCAAVCVSMYGCICVCVFYNIYFVQRGSCLFSACLHFVLLHVIIVVAAAVSLQRHRQTCVAAYVFPSLSLSISLLSLCVCVLSARQLCAVYARLGHTHLAAEATEAAAPRAAQFLHLLQISNGFLCAPFPAPPPPLFHLFFTFLHTEFVTFTFTFRYALAGDYLALALAVAASTCIRQIFTRLVFILFILRCQLSHSRSPSLTSPFSPFISLSSFCLALPPF